MLHCEAGLKSDPRGQRDAQAPRAGLRTRAANAADVTERTLSPVVVMRVRSENICQKGSHGLSPGRITGGIIVCLKS